MLNIATYKFLPLTDEILLDLHRQLLMLCERLMLKGSILLSKEGININLSGEIASVRQFQHDLLQDERFADLSFRESFSQSISFKRLKVKIKKEIITMNQPGIHPEQARAPSISPQELKQWLDEKREVILLDTRNEFEVNYGSFNSAMHLGLKNFSEFPDAVKTLKCDKPVVMFCTGGIRCEKAALSMFNQGFSEVYQLDGGILNYFSQVGQAHYQGGCFVFDDRVVVQAE